MFTGIIEEIGQIGAMPTGKMQIAAQTVLEDAQVGDSIAVNGVCLTVTELAPHFFIADVMPETLRRSSLGRLQVGSTVNLERAMPAYGRFGGHFVSGHIDGVGTILAMRREKNAIWIKMKAPDAILQLTVEKGSIAIDGISLTVAVVDEQSFQVSIIPHTGQQTTLLEKKEGDLVNLENDPIGKYVQKFYFAERGKMTAAPAVQNKEITMDFLKSNGF
ncbi:MAG TPA: riboflavin synthase [Ruminococcaceae bacterium]|nr:riboflavin synthase [Oscillospiraceae bacterium]